MQLKKAEKHNLEKRKFGLMQLGLVVACSLTLVAFEYAAAPEEHASEMFTWEAEELLDIDPTINTVHPPKPKPKPVVVNLDLAPKIDDKVEEVEEKEELKEKPDPFLDDIDPSLFDEEENVDSGATALPPIIKDFVTDMPYWYSEEFIAPDQRQNYTKENLMRFLGKNVKYPQIARDRGEEGTTHISFVINTEGEVTSIKVALSSGSKYLDAEALRAARKLPDFIPGKNHGIPQNVRMRLPVRFILR